MSQITKNNFKFLEGLRKNNTKPYFEKNKDTYLLHHEEMISFADKLLAEVNKFDEIETPTGKKSLNRIYRDIRFSKDKTPYKAHWGGGLKRAGANRRGGFYYHIEKGNSFVGGGFWAPNPKDLLHIRKQIEMDASPLRKVLNSKKFKDYFGGLEGEKLKSSPKGFDKDHENIDLLNHKQFIVWHKFSDKEVTDKDFYKKVAQGFKNMIPLFTVLTEFLTTDLNGTSLLK
jgi:uncharacterized protein (TIGR02453 family)